MVSSPQNMVYTIRRTQEALEEAAIPYEWSGIVWLQGLADDDPDDPDLWKTFGENTVRVWDGFRKELRLGGNNNGPIPIIDTGASSKNQLRSGKEYATEIVDGGLAATVEFGMAADDDTGSCRVTASNPCTNDAGKYMAYRVFDYFGYDPIMLDFLSSSAAASTTRDTTKIFHWWVSYPDNMHSAYEGMILQGRMLANAFLREFSDESEYDLVPFADNDVAELFPYEKCPVGVLPSDENICWIDYRRQAPNETPPSPPSPIPTEAPTAAPTISPTEAPTGTPTAAPVPVTTTAFPTPAKPTSQVIPLTYDQCLSTAAIEIRNGVQSGGDGVFCDCSEAETGATNQPKCYTSAEQKDSSQCSILYNTCVTTDDCCAPGIRTCRRGMCRTTSRTSNRNSLRLSGNRGGAARNERGRSATIFSRANDLRDRGLRGRPDWLR